MQSVDASFHTLAQGDVIPLSWGNRMSFDKAFDDTITFGIYDVSTYDGGDLFSPVEDDPINFWDYYAYTDYSNRIVGMEWSREIEFPYSVSAALADFTMNNTDDFFTPGSGSAIDGYILPKRPVRLLAGYGSQNLQQFVGLTEKAPTLDDTNKTASFHATDFLTEIFAQSLTQVIAMENARTDEVLAAIFDQFGIDPSAYVMDKGRNVIPFVFFDTEKNAGNAIREIMQAEGGHLWIDEQGVIRFETRLPAVDTPVMVLDDSNVIDLVQSGDTGIINYIKIRSTVRKVADYQVIFSNARQGDEPIVTSTGFIIPANSSRIYQADLTDPCLTIDEPALGVATGESWFTAIDADGNSVTSDISVTGSTHNTNQYIIFIDNDNAFPIEIDQMELWGEPARVVNVINYVAKDQASIDKYEKQALGGDEGIANDFFGSEDNCESFALTIIDAYSEFNPTIEASIVGDYSLQLGDVVQLEARGNDAEYRITSISADMYPYQYKIKARRYNPRSWARYDVTVYDDPIDVIAP